MKSPRDERRPPGPHRRRTDGASEPLRAGAAQAHIYIVDADPVARAALMRFTDSMQRLAHPCKALPEFLETYQDDGLGCLVVDSACAGAEPSVLRDCLVKHGVDIPVIFLMRQPDVAAALTALKAGFVDVLAKPVCERAFRDGIEVALQQDHDRRSGHFAQRHAHQRLALLSSREVDVLKHIAAGMTSREIAITLGISFKTVEAHRARMALKLGTKNLAELVRLAVLGGLLPELTHSTRRHA
jgi:FixJ family two-component response regulator